MERPTFDEELYLWNNGYEYVAGIDEVGRGAFAGPLVAGGVVFPQYFFDKDTPCIRSILAGVNDSKLLSPAKREKLSEVIKKHALCTAISEISTSVINKLGIGKANYMAFRQVVKKISLALKPKPSMLFVLVDGFHVSYLKGGLKQQKAIIKGDQKSISIAAASIIAKVYRDSYMSSLPKSYLKYKFAIHKGYGTLMHRELIRKHGLCRLHRASFALQKFTS